ncbi:uncharacterized protein LOC131231865 [Magnolia sinica]|uniref:uncharacterized protein LOC131231865 n=1 Tax=Magnolia sinica TaxID=86752 RepID=UPI00265AA6B3|nr:uncharacterized protein LOC131231865 [Magnolia sinica]XP_058084183.1 uncharacterized protein LOC131231865 [Magnolia sinica]XP_058084195.1 uncharacterized protein LOC131231865 [Magnolia sinica]
MAIPTVDSSNRFLRLGSIPFVDLRFLTQSELSSLSLCSEDAFDLCSCDDTIVPKIDRSIFNESAGSRKQTYSRILLAPHSSDMGRRRRRRPGLYPVSRPPPDPVDDSEQRENRQIVFFLRQLFSQRKSTNGSGPCGDDGQQDTGTAIVLYSRGSEVVNRDGVVIDVAALADCQDPFGPELRKRTEGLETEAELLGFLNGLEGRWGSRRRKRKIVDAAEFGDELPIGWKILIGIKRKEGRVWLYCRRYISPSGQQFETCKEVSSYLHPYVTSQDPIQPVSVDINESTHGTCNVASGSTQGPAREDEIATEVPICYSAVPISSISPDHEKQVLFRVENPAKTQLREILGCNKCNLTFGDKDACVQHLLSFHKRSAKRCRLGKSIGDGVIIRDGKYECQFCHKSFDERRRYNSHVGVHVRDYDKSLAALPDEIIVQTSIDSSSLAGIPLAVSEMDISVEMDNNGDSLPTTPMDKSGDDELNVSPPRSKQDPENAEAADGPQLNALEITQEPLPSKSVDGQDDIYMTTDAKVGMSVEHNNGMDDKRNACFDATTQLRGEEKNVTSDASNEKDNFPSTMPDEIDRSNHEREQGYESCPVTLPDNEQTHSIGTSADVILSSGANVPMLDEMEKCDDELESDFGSSPPECDEDSDVGITGGANEGNALQSVAAYPLSSGCFTSLDMVSDKGEELGTVSRKLENISPFKELGLDDIDDPKIGFTIGQDSSTLSEAPMDLAYCPELEQGLDPSVQFEWDPVLPEVASRHQVTTNCVWCRIEFKLEGFNPETQSDSVGFMCPSCKAKISGQLKVLDNGSPMKSDKL